MRNIFRTTIIYIVLIGFLLAFIKGLKSNMLYIKSILFTLECNNNRVPGTMRIIHLIPGQGSLEGSEGPVGIRVKYNNVIIFYKTYFDIYTKKGRFLSSINIPDFTPDIKNCVVDQNGNIYICSDCPPLCKYTSQGILLWKSEIPSNIDNWIGYIYPYDNGEVGISGWDNKLAIFDRNGKFTHWEKGNSIYNDGKIVTFAANENNNTWMVIDQNGKKVLLEPNNAAKSLIMGNNISLAGEIPMTESNGLITTLFTVKRQQPIEYMSGRWIKFDNLVIQYDANGNNIYSSRFPAPPFFMEGGNIAIDEDDSLYYLNVKENNVDIMYDKKVDLNAGRRNLFVYLIYGISMLYILSLGVMLSKLIKSSLANEKVAE